MNDMVSSLRTLPVGNKLRDMLITEVLGQGGFGITYKAHDPRLNRFVVIKEYMPQDLAVRQSDKTVAPHSGSAAENFHWGLDSFLKEAQTLARFQHPNIVPVLDFFETNGTAYMVMPFIEGETLGRRLEKSPSGIMSEQDIRAWLLPLLDGLQAIHAQGFLHRDLKPENIYLAHNGTSMLIDFGAARNALGSRSRSLSVVLTPGYAPPEQYGSSAANQGPWTDMYALGAVIYRCLTGQAPVDSTERQDATSNGESDPLLPHLLSLPLDSQSPLARAVTTCLQVARKERVQGVVELKLILGEGIQRTSAMGHTATVVGTSHSLKSHTTQPFFQETQKFTQKRYFHAVVVLGIILMGYFLWDRLSEKTVPAPAPTSTQVAEIPLAPSPQPTMPEIPPPSADAVTTPREPEQTSPPVAEVPPVYRLTITTDPPNATVRLMNITPRYKQGMELEAGRYDVEVSASGYLPKRQWVEVLKNHTHINISLQVQNTVSQQQNTEAQRFFEQGKDYEQGRNGLVQSDVQAAIAYRKAADRGHADAMYQLGLMYSSNKGVGNTPDNKGEARRLFQRAAQKGHRNAQKMLQTF